MPKKMEKLKIRQRGTWGSLWQATSVGTNYHSYFTHPLWLLDSTGLVFVSNRGGSNACYLLEWPSGRIQPVIEGEGSNAVVSSDGDSLLYASAGCIVRKAIWGRDREVIARLPDGVKGRSHVGQTCGNENLVLCCRGDGASTLVKAPRNGGKATVFHRDGRQLSHLIPSPAHRGLLSVAWTRWGGGETNQRLWIIGIDGDGMRPLYHQREGELVTHEAWSGQGKVVFTSGPFERRPNTFSVKSIDPLTGDVELLAESGNFWHCCPDRDGSIVVADTNWPDEGIKLIDAGGSEVSTLCYSRSRDTHPHPCFSPDGTKVLFSSDASGSSQIYIAELP